MKKETDIRRIEIIDHGDAVELIAPPGYTWQDSHYQIVINDDWTKPPRKKDVRLALQEPLEKCPDDCSCKQ